MIKKSFPLSQDKRLPKTSNIEFAEARVRNDRQAVFAIVRELVHAQFELADQELTNRLWQDVADRNLDMERIINLMYGCTFHQNDQAMLDVDLSYEAYQFSVKSNQSNL